MEHNHDKKNTQNVCPHCIAKAKREWRQKNILIMPNDYVKGAIHGRAADGHEATEHMWVLVREITPTGFSGILSNKPILLINHVHGDTINVERNDVWDHIKHDEPRIVR